MCKHVCLISALLAVDQSSLEKKMRRACEMRMAQGIRTTRRFKHGPSLTPILFLSKQMDRGKLVKRERFDSKNPAHAKLLRRVGLSVDRAMKRAALARRLAVKGNEAGWQLAESADTMSAVKKPPGAPDLNTW
jgi:hypothetical protein